MSNSSMPPGSVSSPTTPPSPPKPGMSKNVWIAIAAVVVIVIIVAALVLSGVLFGPQGTPSPTEATYNVTFTETGLSSGTSWSVTLGGSTKSATTSSIVFSEKNGTYSFTIGAVSGYSASPASGSVVVTGAAVTKAITFTSSAAATYTVTFTETGLPSGTSWSVTLDGTPQSSTTSSIAFTKANGTYAYSVGSVSGYTVSPSSGTVTVAGAAKSVSITFTAIPAGQYTVTFTESGLASGTSWSVTLGGSTQSSTSTTIVFTKANGTYSYTVGSVSGYTASPSSGSVTVAGAAKSVSITFTAIPAGQYTVTFTESGLPSGTSWSVTLAGNTQTSTTTTITFTKTNGTYSYTVGAVTGYSASPNSGSVTVAGGAQSVSITFTSSGLSGPTHRITWTQTGLPSSDLWSVGCVINATGTLLFGAQNTGASTEFSVPNGNYFWSVDTNAARYVANPAFGNTTVAGADVTISVQFLRTYTVNFTESGLSTSAEWNVTLGGNYSTSFAPDNVTLEVTNGTYSFEVQAFGYTASPATGTITVNGANVSRAITFTALHTYSVTFTESGLPGGTTWSVSLGGKTGASTTSSIVFNMPNGTYPFEVYVVGAYNANPASGTITVSGSAQSKAITFTAQTLYTVTFTETGLPGGTLWAVSLNGTFNYTTAPGSIGFKSAAGAQYFVAYTSGYDASPASGNVTVTTSGATQHITFTAPPTMHKVTFTESGLPSTDWEVSMFSDRFVASLYYYCDNTTSSSTTLVCTMPNGYYTWAAMTSVSGWTANPMAGGIHVNGTDMSVPVTFVNSASKYLVWFNALYSTFLSGGLPNGTSWSVTVNGNTQTTTGFLLGFLVNDGTTAAYTIAAPTGYVVLPSAGNLTGYASPTQSTDYMTVSPGVVVAFAASSGGTSPGSQAAGSPSVRFLGSLAAVCRIQ